jgi:hypothetical protein
MTEKAAERQERARLRSAEYRNRRRRGAMVTWVEVEPRDLAALERLGLLEAGGREMGAVGNAVARFLAAAPAVAIMGDSLWPPTSSD